LIRGNHEFREQNGKKIKNAFPRNGFMEQCCKIWTQFTDVKEKMMRGKELFETMNNVFDWLPLACIIDDKVFCCHGGVPRLITKRQDILACIEAIERPLSRGWAAKNEEMTEKVQDTLSLIADLVWADPCDDDKMCDDNGFADNKTRGHGMKMFNSVALIQFFQATKTTHLIRAHQEQDKGIKIAKNTRCITLFSSSRYQKNLNQAAVIFFDGSKVRVTVTDVSNESV